jgi:hypothetical protein
LIKLLVDLKFDLIFSNVQLALLWREKSLALRLDILLKIFYGLIMQKIFRSYFNTSLSQGRLALCGGDDNNFFLGTLNFRLVERITQQGPRVKRRVRTWFSQLQT